LSSSPGLLDPASFFRLSLDLDAGWPWPLDSVQRFFEDVLSFVVDIPGRVWAFFDEALKGALDWLWRSVAGPLARFALDVWLITDEWTRGWGEPWKSIARLFLVGPAFAYKAMRDAVLPAIQAAGEQVVRAFDGALSSVAAALYEIFRPVVDPIKAFAGAVVNFFTKDVPSFFAGAAEFFASLPRKVAELFDWLTKAFGEGWSALVRFFTSDVPSFFEGVRKFFAELPGMIYDFFTKTLPEGIMNFLRAAWEWLSKNVGEPLLNALKGLWDQISSHFSELISLVVRTMRGLPEAYEREGAEGVFKAMLPILGLGVGAMIAVDLLSLHVLGTGIVPDGVRAFVKDVVCSVFDVKVFTSVFTAIAVQKPLEYAIRMSFRTSRPDVNDSLTFLAKNIIDEEEAMSYLRIAGYPDEIARKYMRSIYKEPPFASVFTAFQRGKMDEGEYRAWLSILNVDKAETLSGVLRPHKAMEEAMWKLPSPSQLAFIVETGELSEDVLKRMLRYELYHPEFVEVVAKGLLWRAARDERSLLRRYVIEDYVEGVARREEVEHYLPLLGVSSELARPLLEFLDSRRRKAVRRKAMSYLERQFLEGYMSREELVEQLRSFGFDEELVQEYAALLQYVRDNYVVVKETRDERSALRAALVAKFKRGLMTEEQLEEELRRLGFSEVEVSLTLARARLEFEAEVAELQLSDLVEQLKRGRLSKSEFVDQATRLGVRYERAMALADYYWSKYVADEFFKMTRDESSALANALVKKYVMGFMTEEQLRDELKRLALTAEEVELRVRRALVEDEVRALEDALREADAMLKKGELSLEDYVSYLASLGMRRERAEARGRRILASARRPAAR